jgi:hypothetical protein
VTDQPLPTGRRQARLERPERVAHGLVRQRHPPIRVLFRRRAPSTSARS